MILIQTIDKTLLIVLKKIFFKLMNNSAFVKTIENLRKRIKVRLVNNAEDYKKCVSKPIFFSQKKFSKNFAAIHGIKPVSTLDKPVYVGFSILHLSKLLMYEFHRIYIKRKYNAKLLLTDTESSVYEIKTNDIYEIFYEDKHYFDFRDSKFFDPVNKKIIGKMKDEFIGKIVGKFVGLKPKSYSLVVCRW